MQDLAFALRQLRRQPSLSVAAVLTLGLGLGASLAVFMLVNAVLLRPLPYPDPDRLMTIGRVFGPQLGNVLPAAMDRSQLTGYHRSPSPSGIRDPRARSDAALHRRAVP
jgi:hypothetical protein